MGHSRNLHFFLSCFFSFLPHGLSFLLVCLLGRLAHVSLCVCGRIIFTRKKKKEEFMLGSVHVHMDSHLNSFRPLVLYYLRVNPLYGGSLCIKGVLPLLKFFCCPTYEPTRWSSYQFVTPLLINFTTSILWTN